MWHNVNVEHAMSQLRERGLATDDPLRRLVHQLQEAISRHDGAQRQLDSLEAPPPPVADYMRATKQILALVAQMVTAHTDLWIYGELALANARTSLAQVNSEHVRTMPYDLRNTVPYEDILNLALAADETPYRCRQRSRSRATSSRVQADPGP